ncbi:hypothetical protein [Bacillus cereus]|uniref:hypothetical protein n=1 Tax=Bacillus cereus group TaxID=86661 RepID=UPI001D0E5121|nr:hypothetical protein [Bacillus cereus]MCC2370044.1 hypothetical protein [Bacillus cereus]MCC2450770.1 hypothetical protein [Bacillus cereus]MCC2491717.1 hypothetical protein [Bacillus cereus]MDF9553292.1 hypothetical protein [Bacillus cereus]HDR8009673.1 hypothetical protein [Bacillus cereus]
MKLRKVTELIDFNGLEMEVFTPKDKENEVLLVIEDSPAFRFTDYDQLQFFVSIMSSYLKTLEDAEQVQEEQ